MPMRRPLLPLTMALLLSVGTLVRADDFVLSRFGEYLFVLRREFPGWRRRSWVLPA